MTPVRKNTTAAVSTRDAVFDSAATRFAKGGFDGVSVDDIARDAGVNKAMIYYHFADKLALYRAVLADGLSRMGASSSVPTSTGATVMRPWETCSTLTLRRRRRRALPLRACLAQTNAEKFMAGARAACFGRPPVESSVRHDAATRDGHAVHLQ